MIGAQVNTEDPRLTHRRSNFQRNKYCTTSILTLTAAMANRMSLPGLKFFRPRINPAQRYPHRRFSQAPLSAYPRKGFEDRNSINAEATEYTKSGTDNQAAEEQGAFDPKVTRPEEQKEVSGKGEQVCRNNRDICRTF